MNLSDSIVRVREQLPNVLAMASAGLRSATPLARSRRIPPASEILELALAPASRGLVDDYIAWSGAPPERYRDVLPPHFFSYWALGPLARLGGRAPYNLLNTLNQGVQLRIAAPLPRGVPLQVRGNLESITNDGRRVRIQSRVSAGTRAQPDAITLDSFAAVMLPGAEKRKPQAAADNERYKTIGRWSATADDGLKFAQLTGDFNPIHTLPAFARRTRFRGCILHGFGMLARSYEIVQDTGVEITGLDIRFIKPLPLPSDGLEVQIGRRAGDDRTALRLHSASGDVHLAGHYLSR